MSERLQPCLAMVMACSTPSTAVQCPPRTAEFDATGEAPAGRAVFLTSGLGTRPRAYWGPYAASKAASDHLVRAFRHTYGLPTLTTNCSNNYGPYHFPEKLIPLMILNALDRKPLPVYGDGGQIRDWLYVEDHVRAIWLVLRNGWPGETYNIGGLSEKTNLEIVRTICALLDCKAPRPDGVSYSTQITHVEDRPGHDRRYAIDCTKIQRELGWRPRESFATGIEKTVDWYLANRSWAEEISVKRYARERLGVIP